MEPYFKPILIIERVEDDGFLPKGFMSEWAGPPESIPEGWVLVDKEELKARLVQSQEKVMEWTEVSPVFEEFEDPPVCDIGAESHEWTIEFIGGDGGLFIGSGCPTCDEAVLGPAGTDDIFFDEIKGSLKFVPEHENLGGWHGLNRCDCGWQWQFIPRDHQ